jgi:hypothetical protein
MLVELHRSPSGATAGGTAEVWSTSLLRVPRLTIGRDSFQHLQLPQPDVEPQHAIIAPRGGLLRIQTCGKARLKINGRPRSKATLATNDTIQIGSATILVRRAEPNAAVILEVREPPERRAPVPGAHQTLTLRGTRINARFWSWALVLGVLSLFVLPQLAASFHPVARSAVESGRWDGGMKAWQPGALHTAHQFITTCDSCHAAALDRVPNERCTACHGTIQHHVDVHKKAVALFAGDRCGSCHIEHLQPTGLIPRDEHLCTDCHADLRSKSPGTKLEDVSDFATGHPDFTVALPAREASNLEFSHVTHMNPKGIKAANGYETLKCQGCHEPNTSGRQMLPIRMERHCARCHSLLFDEHDPSRVVPHGSISAVFDTLQSHFIREYLASTDARAAADARDARRPGGEAAIMTRDEQRRARDWADRQSGLIASELIGKRVCVQCHRVSRDGEGWHIARVRVTQTWMPRARFDHAAHATTECTKCHAAALESKKSEDVLMPGISTCRSCHGGSADSGRVRSDCGMCHQFHLPGRGLFDAPVQTSKR